ncbi:flagellar hook basal-body protein [Granulicella sp. WH15]|uniref:flagellar hook-basal body protein n=1 Tax=Granulicella sp. WH15 TaxID=2602070 RepID=UPI001366BA6F|nr:flagellar hook basal-body protein [Granulicella sp. WH15]QHN03751.1 flagellar hook basal-body protein [Granulicella sp. WH15]
MDSGIYAVYTGLLARTQALDTASNNLANASTSGFRAQRDYFSSLLSSGLDTSDEGSQVGNSVNSYGILGGTTVDMGQGALVPTANPLDLGILGTGFFAITTAQGVRYTRDGQFSRSAAGQLQTATGEPVLDDQGKPITLPTGKIEISSDGIIAVNGAIAGKVGLYSFPAGSQLKAEGINRFLPPTKPDGTTVKPTLGGGVVHQGELEGSNQDSVHGTMNLILIQRQAEMMQKALSLFHNDFDKTATEELSRV